MFLKINFLVSGSESAFPMWMQICCFIRENHINDKSGSETLFITYFTYCIFKSKNPKSYSNVDLGAVVRTEYLSIGIGIGILQSQHLTFPKLTWEAEVRLADPQPLDIVPASSSGPPSGLSLTSYVNHL